MEEQAHLPNRHARLGDVHQQRLRPLLTLDPSRLVAVRNTAHASPIGTAGFGHLVGSGASTPNADVSEAAGKEVWVGGAIDQSGSLFGGKGTGLYSRPSDC